MKYPLLLLAFLLTTPSLFARDGQIDSLRQVIGQTKDGEEKALLLSQLAKSLQHKNLDSAFFYAQKGLTLSEEAGYEAGIAENAAVLGDLFVINNQLDEASAHYSQAASYFQKAGQDFNYAQTSMVLANVMLAQDKYFEAQQIYQYCLDIALQENYTELIPHLYNNLGAIFLNLGDYETALPYFEQAMPLFKTLDDPHSMALTSSNLAFIYEEKGEEEKALDYYIEMVPVFLKQESWVYLSDTYNRITRFFLQKGDLKKAREHSDLSLQVLENNSNTFSGPSSLIKSKVFTTAAELRFQEQEFQESIRYARSAMALDKLNSYQEDMATNSRLMSNIYEKLGQKDSALNYLNQFIHYWEGLEKGESIKQITQQQVQREYDIKLREAELETLKSEAEHKQKEFLYIGIIIISLLSAIILVLLYRSQRNKTIAAVLRKEKLELESEKLNQEIGYKNKELTTNMMYLFEKNEFITYIARKLDEIKPEAKKENKVLLQQIINELKKNSSQSAWDEFELRFMEVHADFYEALNKAFPDLTPNETKLCAFLRLNMTTKEISAITHQSVQSINMARFRLRKKMDMERDENLISFLGQL